MKVFTQFACFAMLATFACPASAQPQPDVGEEGLSSIREEQAAQFDGFDGEADDSANNTLNKLISNFKMGILPEKMHADNCVLEKQVYGYHPYWQGADYYTNYDYSLLTTFSYFSYKLNPYTGGYRSIYNWKTTNSITLAQFAGCRVELCVTNFGGANNARFLGNRKAWQTLADNLVELLNYRNADGINLDFEHIRRQNGAAFTEFVAFLSQTLRAAIPNATVTVAVPALNYGAYDVAALSPHVDSFIIMGYDYHYSGSEHAGPVAPLNGNISINATLDTYLSTGVAPGKFILAVPYYGREWKTYSTLVPSNTSSYVRAPTYANIKDNYCAKYTERWDDKTFTPYFVRGTTGNFKQCWYDSEASLGQKFDLAYTRHLGGVGMWALGYDNGHSDLWQLLEDKFMDCTGTATPAVERKPFYQSWMDYLGF